MELDDLPISTRLHHRMIRAFNSRITSDLEWSADYSNEGSGLDILFFASRSPLLIEFTTSSPPFLRVTEVMYEVGGSMSEVDFCVRETREEDSQRILVRPARILRTGKIHIVFEKLADEVQMQVNNLWKPKHGPSKPKTV